MIVDPDFLDHWKTTMLCDILSDQSAPLCVIRLWGHCQQRRDWKFDIPARGIKALCKYNGNAEDLDQALQECEFISRSGDSVTVIGWDEHNATLVANWNNGKKGGRPKKTKPMDNPSITHGLPMDNPSRTDKIGLDKIGLDKDTIQPDKPAGVLPDEVVKIFNETLGHVLPKVKVMTKARKSAITARIKENPKRNNAGWWIQYFGAVESQDFLIGQGPARLNGNPFCANFDWLINPNNLAKVLEGNYERG